MNDPGMVVVGAVRTAALMWFAVLWYLVARGDWKEQRIAHRYLWLGTLGAIAGYIILASNTGLGLWGKVHWFHYWKFYQAVGTHLFLCATAAMALWVLRVWPAGDAKLFMFLALLYPLTSLFGTFPEERLFLITLINIFIPACVSVFVRAAYYIFDTRLRGGREFLVQLGWKRELEFFAARVRDELASLWGLAVVELRAARDRGWHQELGWLRAGAVALVPTAIRWLIGMASMSVVSYFLKDFFRSPVILSLLCMGMFFLWGYVARSLGLWLSRAVLSAVVAIVIWRNPNLDWRAVFSIFRNITVFSFFMFLGMNWAMKMISGGWGSVGTFLIPFVFPIMWFVIMRVGGLLVDALQWLFYLPTTLLALARGGGPGGPSLSGAHLPYVPWREHAARYGDAVASVRPVVDILMAMAWMGMFFGLSLVLVRKWDEEVRPSHRREHLAPRLVLAPSFIDRLREDEEFFAVHFSSVYADGLTIEQVTALKAWCEENDVDAVPLAPTMSFAFWIFFGFFLSLITGGRHVLQAFI